MKNILAAIFIGVVVITATNTYTQSGPTELGNGYTISSYSNTGPNYGPYNSNGTFRLTGEDFSGAYPSMIIRTPSQKLEVLVNIGGNWYPFTSQIWAANGNVNFGHIDAYPYHYNPVNRIEDDGSLYVGPTSDSTSTPNCPMYSICAQHLYISGVQIY